MNMSILGFTGRPGSPLEKLANRSLPVPNADTARVQEAHLCYGHLLCLQIENHFLAGQTAAP